MQGHDLTYSKLGSFFCDCGAKKNGSCKVRPHPHTFMEPHPLQLSLFFIQALVKRTGAPNDLSGTPQLPPFSDPPSSGHGFGGRGGRKRRKRQLLSKKQTQQTQSQQPKEGEGGEEEGAGEGNGGKDWVHPSAKAKRKSSFPSQPVLKLTQHIEVSHSSQF